MSDDWKTEPIVDTLGTPIQVGDILMYAPASRYGGMTFYRVLEIPERTSRWSQDFVAREVLKEGQGKGTKRKLRYAKQSLVCNTFLKEQMRVKGYQVDEKK